MKQLFLSLCLVMAAMSLQAQSKAEQLKQIRRVYAQAKEKAGSNKYVIRNTIWTQKGQTPLCPFRIFGRIRTWPS